MATIWGRFKMAVKAFREGSLTSDTLNESDFGDFGARQSRYSILWSFYANDAYRNVHTWAKDYKTSYALYQYVRNLYNPAYRLGEFWRAHLLGGALDPLAGDGKAVPSTLPIITNTEELRPAIAALWQWSNWPMQKDITALWGAVMGDVIMRIVDNPNLGKVYIERLHPGIVESITKDEFGNIKGYILTEQRPDPRNGRPVTYREQVVRDGPDVVYRTTLNDAPFAWNGEAAEWSAPYGFVPMVHIQHNDVGLSWGWSELHPARSKIHELDDQASLLSDQVRKIIAGSAWLITTKKPTASPTPSTYTSRDTTETSNTTRPMVGREEMNVFWTPDKGTTATPMTLPLDIAGIVANIQEMVKELERDYPELRFDNLRQTGTVSGQTLREARKPTETKVRGRRAVYDAALVKLHQMAVSIGGWRGYPGFQGFGLDSYAAGALEHHIGDRPVFFGDQFDRLEEQSVLWAAAKSAGDAGLPLRAFLLREGWTLEELAAITGSLRDAETAAKRWDAAQVPILTRWREAGYTDEQIERMKEDKRQEDEFGVDVGSIQQ